MGGFPQRQDRENLAEIGIYRLDRCHDLTLPGIVVARTLLPGEDSRPWDRGSSVLEKKFSYILVEKSDDYRQTFADNCASMARLIYEARLDTLMKHIEPVVVINGPSFKLSKRYGEEHSDAGQLINAYLESWGMSGLEFFFRTNADRNGRFKAVEDAKMLARQLGANQLDARKFEKILKKKRIDQDCPPREGDFEFLRQISQAQ